MLNCEWIANPSRWMDMAERAGVALLAKQVGHEQCIRITCVKCIAPSAYFVGSFYLGLALSTGVLACWFVLIL